MRNRTISRFRERKVIERGGRAASSMGAMGGLLELISEDYDYRQTGKVRIRRADLIEGDGYDYEIEPSTNTARIHE